MRAFVAFEPRASESAHRWESAVAQYRMFLLDGRGHILAREEYEAGDDADAIAQARAIFAERPHFGGFEVWELSRVVHREERP